MSSDPEPTRIDTRTPPAAQGFRMPAEWEPHEATWLTWPHNETTWRANRLREVQALYCDFIDALSEGENVKLLIPDEREEAKIRKRLPGACRRERLQLFIQATGDVWIRDYGPTFILKGSGQKACVKWEFNAWGKKYPDLLRDNEIFREGGPLQPCEIFPCSLVLEGGAVEVNGGGVGLITESSVCNPNRNPGSSRKEIERVLKEMLGLERIIWLKEGILGDDTDGHIDGLARFVSPRVILTSVEKNTADPNFHILHEQRARLEKAAQENPGLKILDLPVPAPVIHENERLPATYANFYIANKAVFVPAFRQKADREAAALLREHFPKRDVISLGSLDLIRGLGALHCITQQEPALGK